MNGTVRLLLVILLILLLIGMLPAWPYSSGWGWYPSGGVGLLLLVVVILAVLGGAGDNPRLR
jgi:peptidoglycan/LPS O-acetylase OafA/YrhL